MKTNKKQLELFTKECNYWINKFKITGWDIKVCGMSGIDSLAKSMLELRGRVVSIWLNEEYDELNDFRKANELKKIAKHEIIHILIGRLTCLSDKKYITDDERYEAVEELVVKLEKLL